MTKESIIIENAIKSVVSKMNPQDREKAKIAAKQVIERERLNRSISFWFGVFLSYCLEAARDQGESSAIFLIEKKLEEVKKISAKERVCEDQKNREIFRKMYYNNLGQNFDKKI